MNSLFDQVTCGRLYHTFISQTLIDARIGREGMVDQVLAKGATPIISSTTPDNPYNSSTITINAELATQFVKYAADAAADAAAAKVCPFDICHLAPTDRAGPPRVSPTLITLM